MSRDMFMFVCFVWRNTLMGCFRGENFMFVVLGESGEINGSGNGEDGF